MDGTIKAIIQGVVICLGVLVPIGIILFNRLLKSYDDKERKRSKEIDDISDDLQDSIIRLSNLETDIWWIKNKLTGEHEEIKKKPE